MSSYYLPDPIQGTIELPQWLVSIKDEPVIRRMLFIRQLGLKAYIDFPGAIHTRYSHALGTMALSEKMAKMLKSKMANKGKKSISENLKDNMNNIMAAGFFHDIGHAPFSHALDYVLEKTTKKCHEELSEEIIKSYIPREIEDSGITKSSVIQIIGPKTHNHPFLSQIINGPLDCDKLDYLLRDAYHVGVRYSFDLNLFLNSYTVIGQESDLKKCILGLDLTKRAIVTAELFIVIWKSMYDLVYFVEQSRISEKMLEKAFLLHADEQAVKDIFTIDRFIMTNDENILTDVKKLGPDIERFLAIEDPKRLYLKKYEIELNKKNFRMTNNFLAKLENTDELADQLSVQLCSELKFGKYDIICDIIKSKAPREIYLENPDIPDQEAELRDESDVVGVINAKNNLKVYVSPKILKDLDVKQMRNVLKKMVEEEVELG